MSHLVDHVCDNLALIGKEPEMPKIYPVEVRRTMCERMLNGERIEMLALETSISTNTLYRWRRQALVDTGQSPGLKSYDPDPLSSARRRIVDLEKELTAVKLASRLFEQGEANPKGSSRL
jgi:transposase-like protein